MFQDFSKALLDEIQRREIAKTRAKSKKFLAQINKQQNLSQGFLLVNQSQYKRELAELKAKLKNSTFQQTPEGQMSKLMLAILESDTELEKYLDKDVVEEVHHKDLRWGSEKPKPNTSKTTKVGTGIRYSDRTRNQLSSLRFKRKQLFLFYKRIIEAQVALRVLCDDVVSTVGGKVCAPPGAFNGIKSFNGALNKITQRERSDEVGDLKDCARMTIEFDNQKQMLLAKAKIAQSQEFLAVKGYQKALKDRYSSGTQEDGLLKFNSSAQKSGYKDIKFFLKMSNGVIGELQLNTKDMLIAKEKEHVIYDILRESKDQTKPYTISNPDVVIKIREHMNDGWFSFIETKVPEVKEALVQVRQMVKNIPMGISPTLTVMPKQAEALNKVSLGLYAKGELPGALVV
ncbi:hypothetical protein [Vibrio coralliilyticus]|uniref:hypothetical protein n=1 Tax=Vibrio coralliilyticus TaxID=190893 RepID=UPI00148D5186|nr:hypothetical protein [Vibrio coralliilyticus]NOI27373.1 hypothetical protein [Vibrio coralliilyticus]NOI46336.1 hypothetical protein [Vibrio coralliilyticus]